MKTKDLTQDSVVADENTFITEIRNTGGGCFPLPEFENFTVFDLVVKLQEKKIEYAKANEKMLELRNKLAAFDAKRKTELYSDEADQIVTVHDELQNRDMEPNIIRYEVSDLECELRRRIEIAGNVKIVVRSPQNQELTKISCADGKLQFSH